MIRRAARRFGWSKPAPVEKIAQGAHETEVIDSNDELCYTVHEQRKMEAHETIDPDDYYRLLPYLL